MALEPHETCVLRFSSSSVFNLVFDLGGGVLGASKM